MADWQDILIPLAVALTNRNQKGAAFLQGYQQSSRLQTDRQRQQERDAQQAEIQQAQLRNLDADNARADQQFASSQEAAALQRLQAALRMMEPTIQQQAETATDPTVAENAILSRTTPLEGAFGLPPGQLSGFVPPMQPMISARMKKQAQSVHADFVKQYGDQASEAEGTLRLTVGPFAGKTLAEVRVIAEALPPPPAPKVNPNRNLQSKEVLRGGKRAIVNFEPDTGKYFDLAGQEAADIAPIPPASASQSGGADPRSIALFNRIAGEYDRSPLVRAADRTLVLDDAIKTIEANPADPASQLRLAYSYIQALDTYQSAVREGELGNLGILGTKLQQWQMQLNKVASEGAFLPPEVAKNIARDAKQLVQVIGAGAERKRNEFKARATVSGVGEMWNSFVASSETPAAAKPTTTGGPRVGERRQFPDGRVGEWDGKGWKAVQ
jgi:hypothetical protein